MSIDVLLVNMRTPRLRSLSDNIIENGLSILREHLLKFGITAAIEDKGTIDNYESFSPREITDKLHDLSGQLLEYAAKGVQPPKELAMSVVQLQLALDKEQEIRMEQYLQNLVDRVIADKIPIVGKKVWYGHSFKWANRFTQILNERAPEVIVVDGGPHPSVYQEHYVRESLADLIVMSEGETALTKIAHLVLQMRSAGHKKQPIIEAIKNSGMNNIAYKDGGKIVKRKIINLPLDYKAEQRIDTSSIDGRLRIGVITDALGCPHNACNFCAYKNIYSEYMKRSIGLVVDEIEHFTKSGVGIFRDSSGSNSLDYSVERAREILRRGLSVNFSFFNRCEPGAKDKYNQIVDQYAILIEAGLRAVFMGMESGNDRILQHVMNKGATREDIIYTFRAMREASRIAGPHLDISFSCIYPHPLVEGVTLEQAFQDTLSLIKETMPDSILPNPPGPFPGSPWYNNPRFGFVFY